LLRRAAAASAFGQHRDVHGNAPRFVGHIRSPKEGERYFALLKVNSLNFDLELLGERDKLSRGLGSFERRRMQLGSCWVNGLAAAR
jgi:transcription termination factor Rho